MTRTVLRAAALTLAALLLGMKSDASRARSHFAFSIGDHGSAPHAGAHGDPGVALAHDAWGIDPYFEGCVMDEHGQSIPGR